MAHLKSQNLIIRADASAQVGTGHLMRCLALGQAWQDAGGKVVFITACQSEALLQRLNDERFDLHQLSQPYPDLTDWAQTGKILAACPDAWVALDGYHFDEIYQQKVKDAGHRLLVIDDMAQLKHYYADIVLNQNLHAEQLHYSVEPYTRLLLGTRYVLLRREFLTWKDRKRETPEIARKVLVTLGGSDPNNVTLEVIKALRKVDIPGLEATVVIGASNTHAGPLEKAAKQSPVSVRLVRDVKNMPELMAWADVAVSSGGSAVWELAFMGVPSIIIATTLVEEYMIKGLDKYGLFSNLNWFKEDSVEQLEESLNRLIRDDKLRNNMSLLGQQSVDYAGHLSLLKYLMKVSTV